MAAVREGEVEERKVEVLLACGRELDGGFSCRKVGDFDVMKGDVFAKAFAKCFDNSFFCAEADSEAWGGMGVFKAVLLFWRGKEAVEEFLTIFGHGRFKPFDFNDIRSNADDIIHADVRRRFDGQSRGGHADAHRPSRW